MPTQYFGKYPVGHTTAIVPVPSPSAFPHFRYAWQEGFVSDEFATAVTHVAPSQQFLPTPYFGKYPVGHSTAVVPAPALSAYPHFPFAWQQRFVLEEFATAATHVVPSQPFYRQ